MKKTMVVYKGINPYRCGSVYEGVVYVGGVPASVLPDNTEIVKENVKTLKVYSMNKYREINRQGKVMELHKRNGTVALVRDEYDQEYIAMLCDTFYSSYKRLLILNIIITEKDKAYAKIGSGSFKKRWVLIKKLD